MPKHAELVQKLNPIKREEHKGYFLYLYGMEKGIIDGVYRSKIVRKKWN